MAIIEKIKYFVIPSFLLIGLGIFEVKYPHLMDSFDDGYTGHGKSGLTMLLLELFIKFTWGKIEGFLAILLGVFLIVIGFLPDIKESDEKPLEQLECNTHKNSSTGLLSSIKFRAGKSYLQSKFRNRQP
jgi:hypothetical protein